MPQPKLFAADDALKGINPGEAGISAESVTFTFDDPKSYLEDEFEGRRAIAVGYDPSRTLAITGEVINNTVSPSLQKAAFGIKYATTQVFGDDHFLYTDSSGTATSWTDNWLLDSATSEKSRADWWGVSATFTEVPNINVTDTP